MNGDAPVYVQNGGGEHSGGVEYARKNANTNVGADVLCGPLLRYTYTNYGASIWNGSILLVTKKWIRPIVKLYIAAEGEEIFVQPPTKLDTDSDTDSDTDKENTFWRVSLAVPISDREREVTYTIELDNADKSNWQFRFYVPAKEETMRLIFHSCNGFSLGVKEGSSAGPVLWEDVMRIHKDKPFHVMIGGGDQVYSDGVRATGPLTDWANSLSPRRRAKEKVTPKLRKELDDWYFNNYCEWFTRQPFRGVAASIPALQIFDDHDIIDGYGSYKDKFMKAPIFEEIGKVAWKYYMLFQQHTPPGGETLEDPSWVVGKETGPYIKQKSRSICTTLGKRVVFYGLDCRVDRTIDRICYKSTYDAMFERLETAVTPETRHFILLLGVPIAYPRLVWLENLLSTHTVTPLRWLNKLFGVAAGFFNKFDGSVELLDDLNDHWCAHTHKRERNEFMHRLQSFSHKKRVRITILSGDVHLACIGRFFSKSSLGMPQSEDYRYIVNIVSSAITNAPPPNTVANLLNRLNKIHHLDENTDENLMDIFHQMPNGEENRVNHTTLPARNYCIITEHAGRVANLQRQSEGGSGSMTGNAEDSTDAREESASDTEGLAYAQKGGVGDRSARAPHDGTLKPYALDVCIRAEIDPKDPMGSTLGYGFSIPALEMQ